MKEGVTEEQEKCDRSVLVWEGNKQIAKLRADLREQKVFAFDSVRVII